jgi:hypothetical protein
MTTDVTNTVASQDPGESRELTEDETAVVGGATFAEEVRDYARLLKQAWGVGERLGEWVYNKTH